MEYSPHSFDSKPLSKGRLCPGRSCEQPEGLRRLFEILASGRTPNFLEFMSAISDMVAFSTDVDSLKVSLDQLDKNMSQKKCRFCD